MPVRKYSLISNTQKRQVVEWYLECGDTGQVFETKYYSDNTVNVHGTFNSQTLTMQGASDDDFTNPFTLTDNNGLGVALTAAGGRLLAEAPTHVRPSFSGSSGGALILRATFRRA